MKKRKIKPWKKRIGRFTYDIAEEEQLESLVRWNVKKDWGEISDALNKYFGNGRSANACRTKYYRLTKDKYNFKQEFLGHWENSGNSAFFGWRIIRKRSKNGTLKVLKKRLTKYRDFS